MTPERDVYSTPAAQAFPIPASAADEERSEIASSLFQEINERRARVENAELLRRLRGL